MGYAERTKVPVQTTRSDIESVLKKNKADRIAVFQEPDRATIVFEAHERRIKFELPLPPDIPSNAARLRQRWRALLLCIKAKMESVESGIETFEEAFLSHVVLPNGMTVNEMAREPLAQIYSGGEMRPLLPPPGRP